MNIKIICSLYPEFGGLETHVRKISERLAKKGCDIEVICTDPWNRYPKSEFINNITVTRFPAYAPNNAFFIAPQITSYLNNIHDADIIHVHGYNALPSYFASLTNNLAKFIYTPHYHRGGHTFLRNLLHYPYRIFAKNTFNKADKVICVSKYEKNILLSDFNIPESKISVIPNGIDINLKDLNIEKIANSILYVGRIEKYKNIQQIIKSLPYLKDFTLDIVGDGEYKQDIIKLSDKLNVSDRVKWYKDLSKEELLKKYCSSAFFINLSEKEAFSISTAEATVCNNKCIVSKIIGLQNYINKENSLSVNPYSVAEIVSAIKKLNKTDFTYRKNYNICSWDEASDKTINLYKEILQHD